MKPTMIAGLLLLVLGAAALGYQGITYTTKEKVVEVGPVQVTTEREKTIPLPPVLGGAAVAVGVALLLVRSRRP